MGVYKLAFFRGKATQDHASGAQQLRTLWKMDSTSSATDQGIAIGRGLHKKKEWNGRA
jgi:hypothetical protein